MKNELEILKERGFLQQCSDEEGLQNLFTEESVTFYVGVDPTAASIHCGHLIPLIAMRHLQSFGHKAILLAGGGTARIGDPSGKTESRQLISYEEIDQNVAEQREQFKRVLDFSEGKTRFLNNKEWLHGLNYIDFLRDIGKHFSVNRMLTFETYKKRLETGLSFIEFNYQLLQSYDYLILNERENCQLQIGGDDQWGNIIAGMELVRRVRSNKVYALTFPLITTSDGKKMGKTEKGAIFLDKEITPVFDFFQYWRNISDADVRRFLLLYTFLPVEECDRLTSKEGKELNHAKEILAFEVTKMIHGEEEASKAREVAKSLFSTGGDQEGMPTISLEAEEIEGTVTLLDLLVKSNLSQSKSEARRLIEQGGAKMGGVKVTDPNTVVTESNFQENELILQAGKKRFAKILYR